jgi:ABC-type Fe2+-enterobactin transport system substrate-binding protein
MRRKIYTVMLVFAVIATGGVASAQQYPIMDEIAQKVIQKYRNASCEQLWQQRGQPKSPREQEAIQVLQNDPQMRAAFIDRVAAPVANKMFVCGLLP